MKRGFSILEILIAMTIILMAITATTLMSPGTQSTSVDSQLNIEGLNKAQELLENEQALSRKDFKLVNPVATTTSGQFQTAVYATSLDLFTKKVTAFVSWTPQYGRTQSTSLSTLVSNFQGAVGGDTCSSILSGNWASPSATNLLFGTIVGDTPGTYQISDLDAYQQRLYVSVNNTAGPVSLGPNYPANAVADSSIGTVGWGSIASAKANDGTYATASISTGQTTNYIKVSGFGFAIPSGATILGIKAEVYKKGSSSSATIKDASVKLVRADGTLGATSKADATSWPTSPSTPDTYGSTSDLWGETGLSATAVNNANFGLAIAATTLAGSGSRTASVDYVRLTVTYTKQLYILNATNPTNPTFINGLGQNAVGTGVSAVAVATSIATGSYAFLAMNSTAGQVEVVDVATTTPVVTTSYTVTGGPVANTLFYKDGYLYLGLANNAGGPELYILDVHNPLSIPALLPGEFTYDVGAGVESIYVKNNKVYLATDNNAQELVVLDVSDLAHPALYGTYDAPGASLSGYGKSVYTVGDTLAFGRTYSLTASTPEFHVISTAGAAPAVLGSYDIGPNNTNPFGVYGIVVRDYLTFLLTSSQSNGGKLQVLNTAAPASITPGASVTLPNSGGGVALDCEGNYLFAASVPPSGTFQNRASITAITAP